MIDRSNISNTGSNAVMTLNNHLWAKYPTPKSLPSVAINNQSLPLVSIVTPSYNQGHFLRETIESVLTQDYPNIEYWVIDGGSKDETISILKDYEKDPRFHWISEKDKGQSDAINKGWSRCRGEILAWLNSDDTYLPYAISTQVQALLSHQEYGAVYGDGIFIDRDSKLLYKCYGLPYNVIELLRVTIPLQPTVFIRRSVCEQVGTLSENFKYSMDSEYWVRVSKVTAFWYEPQLIATYRLHQQSKTVGDYSGFYADWLSIAKSYFADPEIPKVYQKQKQQVYAGIYSRIAAIEAENGSLIEMAKYLFKALRAGGIRPRIFKSILLSVERILPLELTPRLIEVWTSLRRKFN